MTKRSRRDPMDEWAAAVERTLEEEELELFEMLMVGLCEIIATRHGDPGAIGWETGSPGWRCANCGRANIYHDPKTGACPRVGDAQPKVS